MNVEEASDRSPTDQADPVAACADFDEALDKSIQDWAAKARQVEIIRAQNLALSETNDAIEALRRLREIGMEHAERKSREGRGVLTFAEQDAGVRGVDPGFKFQRIARAVRQIVVLQQELLGQRPVAGMRAAADAPAAVAQIIDAKPAQRDERSGRSERSDLADRERQERNDLYDYDDRAYGEVVADVEQVLGVSLAAERDIPAKAPSPHKPFKPRPRLTASASPVDANARERGPPSS